jgi:hypothetical protein
MNILLSFFDRSIFALDTVKITNLLVSHKSTFLPYEIELKSIIYEICRALYYKLRIKGDMLGS